MSRSLLAYLDDLPCGPIASSPEYSYLGHFRDMEYLDMGHNELELERQIEEGNIPDLQAAGKNTPAEAEPGSISSAGNAPSLPAVSAAPAASKGGSITGTVDKASGLVSKAKTLFDL